MLLNKTFLNEDLGNFLTSNLEPQLPIKEVRNAAGVLINETGFQPVLLPFSHLHVTSVDSLLNLSLGSRLIGWLALFLWLGYLLLSWP